MHDFIVTVVAFIVLIGLMVIVHEFGHFAVAKLCRVRVEAFSFGFGPRLFGYKYGDTDYKICLLPLGGYVKMTGEIPGEEVTLPNPSLAAALENGQPVGNAPPFIQDPGAFTSHPRWQRILIGLAGPTANFILAFTLMFFYFGVINEVPATKPTLEWIAPGSVADNAGIKPGDTIVSFGSLSHPDLGAVTLAVDDSTGQTVPVTVDRNGQQVALSLPIPADDKTDESTILGYPHITDKPLTIHEVSSGSASAEAGLHAGDRIVSIDGHAFHTLDPLVAYLKAGKGQPVTVQVAAGDLGVTRTVVLHPQPQGDRWLIGVTAQDYGDFPVRRAPMGFTKSAARAKDYCVIGSKMIGQMLGKLVTHQASVKQLSGPVGIAVAAGEAAETKDWSSKFGLASAISLNLGILNLMPFPILDGGMILFLLIESAMRRDISMRVKEYIYQGAFVVIVLFFAFIIFNDVSNLPIIARLRQ